MRVRNRVLPYKMGSQSAKALAAALGLKRIYPDHRSNFIGKGRDTVINWGSSAPQPKLSRITIINRPERVAIASDKLKAFRIWKEAGVPVPEFTTSAEEAKKWLQEGRAVFARTLLNSHSGRGIVELEGAEAHVPYAPMYVKYINKKLEYRIHVLPIGKTVVRQKRKRLTQDGANFRVRNHANGFVFCRDLSFKPEGIEELAKKATKALGLDFAALDIIYNERDNSMYVLEANTAPGLEGETITEYANAFRERLNGYYGNY